MTRTSSQSTRRTLSLLPDDRESYPELYALGYNGQHAAEYGAAERMVARAQRRSHRPRITTAKEG